MLKKKYIEIFEKKKFVCVIFNLKKNNKVSIIKFFILLNDKIKFLFLSSFFYEFVGCLECILIYIELL